MMFSSQLRRTVTSRNVITQIRFDVFGIFYSTQRFWCRFVTVLFMVKRKISNEKSCWKSSKKEEPYNNETIMLSECATLLRDIRFGTRFFGEKGRRFFFYS